MKPEINQVVTMRVCERQVVSPAGALLRTYVDVATVPGIEVRFSDEAQGTVVDFAAVRDSGRVVQIAQGCNRMPPGIA